MPQALTRDGIREVVDAFAAAARRAGVPERRDRAIGQARRTTEANGDRRS